MIPLTADVVVTTPNITLTCATPGSGLFAQAGGSAFDMLTVSASGVVVDGLVLDGSNAADPYFGFEADGLRFTNNTVTCSPAFLGGTCAFFSGTPNAVVSGNQFVSNGSLTGLHMQAGIDGARIEDNTITTFGPSVASIFGGLRIRDGANVVIARNIVHGPWRNSGALADLASSTIEQNEFLGAILYGIRARSGASLRPVSMTDNVLRDNRISGAGSAGILLTSACSNQIFGNNLDGNAGDIAVLFDVPTGANVVVVERIASVVDNGGTLDCNGDGRADPNIIVLLGPGGERRGGAPPPPPPDTLGAAVSQIGRLR